MKIAATELKQTLKKLSPVASDVFQVGMHGIAAKDSEVWVVVDSPLSELGSFTVAGKKLTQVANRMSGTVELTATETALTLKSVKAEITLEVKAAKPVTLPKVPERTLELKAAEFKKAVAIAVAAASPNKSAPFGGVVQVKSAPLGLEEDSPSGYRVAGTDSKVLTVVNRSGALPHEVSALVNLTASGLVQLMESETITFGDYSTGLYFRSGSVTGYAARPEKVYPNLDPLLAGKYDHVFQFNPAEWLEALRTIEPVIEETFTDSGVGERKITLHFSDGVVQFNSSGTGATAKDEASYEQIEPDSLLEMKDVTLAFEVEHLSGFLVKASGEATLKIVNMKTPAMLESDGIQVMTFLRTGTKL